MSVPIDMKAVVFEQGNSVVKTVPVQKFGDDEALIKTEAVALNPTDWKHVHLKLPPEGALLGCDVSGTVVAVGSKFTAAKIGDAITTFISGGSKLRPNNGAFAEYVIIKNNDILNFKDRLTHANGERIARGPVTSFEAAASLPVGWLTNALAFGHYVKEPLVHNPSRANEIFLVWGGSTSLGQAAIQLGKYIGYKVITTCSPYNGPDLLKLGASEWFNYKDADVLEKIRAYVGESDNITLAYDTISIPPTGKDVYSLMSKRKPSILLTSLYFDAATADVKNDNVAVHFPLLYLASDEEKSFGITFYSSPEMRADFRKFKDQLQEVFDKHPETFKHMPIKALDGIEHINEGLDLLKNNKVSGEKIVVRF